MKFLTDRHEIAEAINIKEMPVIVMNVRECMKGYDRCYKGDKVVVDDIRCTAEMFGDQNNEGIMAPQLYKEIFLMPDTVCLDAGFGYHDVMEMAEWRKAMRLTEGGEVLVIFDAGTGCHIRRMKVGKVTRFVFPAAKLVDIDE